MESCNRSAVVTALPGATTICPSRPATVSGAQVAFASTSPL